MVFEQYIVNDYARALIIGIILFIIIRLGVFIILKITLSLTKKTKTDLDDIIIKRSSMPITAILFLLNIKIPINELNLSESLGSTINNILFSLGVLTIGYLGYIIADIILSRGLKRVAKKTKTDVDDNLVSVIQTIIRIIILILALLYVLTIWGIEIGPLLAGLGIAGLAVALALQPVLSNIFSGVSMILDKSVRTGDLVYLDSNAKGTVEKIGLRSTKIRTFDNELIIVPNNKLAESQIQNVALPEPKSRVVIPFSVAYGSNVEKVKKIVMTEIKSIKNIVKDPEPMVRFLEMGDSSLNFKAYFYVDSYENRFSSIDEANTKIYNALNKNKISIPFPQLDVNLKK